MSRRYQIDELLALRSSPLVEKPADLPPAEEWMGPPIPEPRRTTNPRDHTSPNEPGTSSNRRPSLFEARHISRGSNSEDIVLGPPKTAFASSRIASKGSIDATERPSKPFDSEEPRNDRFNFREKIFRDPDFERRDARPGTFNFRRGEKEDGRARRTFGPDDDRKPRRNGEFDRWEGRDNRDQRENERFGSQRDGRFPPRREGFPGRGRLEGSWFRDDNADGHDAEEDKPPIRNREWRRDRHGADREWHRGSKFEQDPEWLDSTEPDEPRRGHTQQDFERWKERMKAGSAQAHGEDKKDPVEKVAGTGPKAESRPTDGEIFSHGGTPFQPDATMERFFGFLGEKKPTPAVSTSSPIDSPTKEKPPGKPGKSSRFAGFFSPPPETRAKEPEPQAAAQSPAPNLSNDADQEGFQRILQMLGGSKSRNGTPHNDQAQPILPSMQQEQTRSALPPLATEPLDRPEYMGLQDPASARSAGPPMPENPLPEDYEKEDPNGSRTQLLRLMQHVQINPARNAVPDQGQPQSAGPGPAPGLMNMPDVLPRPPGLPAQKAPGFMDDPAIANMPRQEGRRPPMGFFDDAPFPPNSQVPITPGGSRAPQGQSHGGMGIQRPPGFEHVPPPPGWVPPQLPPQQGAPGPLPPPPGIPTRGVNPNIMSNMMPMHGNMPPLSERPPFPRGPGSNGSAAFGPPPPGMMPPPGYMNMNGPPPSGFPPMPHNPEAFMGPGHGQGPFGGQLGPQGPPSSRHLLEVFGQGNGDGRGMPPGQYGR